MSTLFKTGRVTLPVAMRLTLFKALANFSWATSISILILSLIIIIFIYIVVVVIVGSV